MWFERILIIWNTLGDTFLPSTRHAFVMSAIDWIFLLAPLGLFAFLFLLFARFFPVVSMYEVRELAHKAREDGAHPTSRRPAGEKGGLRVSAPGRTALAEFADV